MPDSDPAAATSDIPTAEDIAKLGETGGPADLGRLMAWRQAADGARQVACTEAIARLIQRHLHGEFAHLGGAVRDQIVGVLSSLDLSLRQRISQNLASSDIMVQLRTVQLLGMMGNAAAVKSALTRALKSSDPKVRATVISVFRTVANRQDLNLLLDLTKDEDVRVRANVVEVLGELEEKGVISVLLQFKHDPNNRIRANCLRALWRLGHAPAEIESSVAKMIDDPDDKMRASAAWLIGEIGGDDPRFSAMLKKLMADPAELVQTNVMKALLKIGGGGAQKLLGLLFADAGSGAAGSGGRADKKPPLAKKPVVDSVMDTVTFKRRLR